MRRVYSLIVAPGDHAGFTPVRPLGDAGPKTALRGQGKAAGFCMPTALLCVASINANKSSAIEQTTAAGSGAVIIRGMCGISY